MRIGDEMLGGAPAVLVVRVARRRGVYRYLFRQVGEHSLCALGV